jgi:D-alanine-D-alanine ligase
MAKHSLLVFFGGITVEHEVSVITGLQLIKHADPAKYDVTPVYIDKSGKWWSGPQLLSIETFRTLDTTKPTGLEPFSLSLQRGSNPFDAALLCFHGAYGEAGNIQGVLEVAGIPYQGPGVTSSALAFDKIMTRLTLAGANVPQTAFTWFTATDWAADKAAILTKAESFGWPVFVKAANGGSTIGTFKVNSPAEFDDKVSQALQYDTRIIMEKAVTDCIEVNVSVLGLDGDAQASVPEQPISADEFLSYADKYQRGGKKSGMASATRRIPAPISSRLTTKLQTLAKEIFRLFDCSGVVRIDFFANPSTEEVFVTELNTIPGSMSFYLWEATGMPYSQLIDRLVEIAVEQHKRRSTLVTSFDSPILQTSKV